MKTVRFCYECGEFTLMVSEFLGRTLGTQKLELLLSNIKVLFLLQNSLPGYSFANIPAPFLFEVLNKFGIWSYLIPQKSI
jgi:hypothetical protein